MKRACQHTDYEYSQDTEDAIASAAAINRKIQDLFDGFIQSQLNKGLPPSEVRHIIEARHLFRTQQSHLAQLMGILLHLGVIQPN